MPLFHLIIVAIVQGVTEFLPVSSSGHLVLLPSLTGLPDQGLAIDVAVHVGTLLAVILYFRDDMIRAARGIPPLLRGDTQNPSARLTLCLIIATIPVVMAGLIITVLGLSDALRSVEVVAWATLIFAVVLYVTDQKGASSRGAEDWSLRDAAIMGAWQMLALIPGTSRSGITISGARYLGYERSDAARLAMLMSVPTILAAGALLGAEITFKGTGANIRDILIVAAFSFVAAIGALSLMMRLLRSVSFTPYVLYRLGLGAILLFTVYG